uniref:Major facilitator superfamily (MFS) profile domain-containing protein n=1 Tax=Romanomermis culicivorax TaxID=13658 RepID=A0A915IXV2_ROMCU
MGGNKYAAVAFGGLFEMLAAFILFTTLNLLGRKFHCFAGFIFAGSCIFLSTIVHNDFQIIKMLCISLGRMAIATVYGVLYVWTPELYPTSIRMTAVGLCSMMARIGGVMASYVFLWIADIYPKIVASSISMVCIFTGILILLLPDTNGQPQPETIHEVEILSKTKRKMFLFGWNVGQKRQTAARKIDINDNVDIKF